MAVPEPKYRNSAGRLLAILSALPANQSLIESIPALFGTISKIQQEKQQASMVGMMEIHKLYLEFVEDMNDAQINEQQRGVILSGLGGLRDSIYPLQLNAIFRPPSDAEKSLLEVAATIIPQEAPIAQDDLDAIRDSIASLRTLVEDGSISPTLRKVLLDLIRLSEDAISRFNIRGARGLKKAFKAMLAEVAEAYASRPPDDQQEEAKKPGAWGTIVKHLKTVDKVASRLLHYKPLFEAASRLLLGGPQP